MYLRVLNIIIFIHYDLKKIFVLARMIILKRGYILHNFILDIHNSFIKIRRNGFRFSKEKILFLDGISLVVGKCILYLIT